MSNLTPMMLQYRRIKQQHAGEVLFFRMGDFYEMFEKDAKEVSSILDITLTQRAGVPMCGIPYHAAEGYIARLLKAGKKIAVCEQTHVPRAGQGLATREVVEVITPGTVVDESYLERHSNNYLVAIGRHKDAVSFSFIDLSTADFYATAFDRETSIDKIKRELYSLTPREIIVQESLLEEDDTLSNLLFEKDDIVLNRLPDWSFDLASSRGLLVKQLGVNNLKGYGLTDDSPEILSAGVILEYVQTTSKALIPHLKELHVYHDTTYLGLDEATQKNLELLRNLQDGSRRYTLLEALDYCRTSMGGRKLRRWIVTPLIEKKQITERLDRVEFFYRNQMLLSELRETLSRIPDLERLSSKVAMDRAHAKNLLSIKHGLSGIRELLSMLCPYPEMKSFVSAFGKWEKNAAELEDLLQRSIQEDPSILLTEGDIIKDGYDQELDGYRDTKKNSRKVLEKLLVEERESTGIASLKLRFNRIIGYFFEVTKSNLSLVPQHFIRRQSLVSGERFTTEKLTALESDITSAIERIYALEKKLFLAIREKVKARLSLLMESAALISELDCLQSFAFSATIHGYCKPRLNNGTEIFVSGGRHPVVEANIPSGSFVPNDIELGSDGRNFVLLTGPNMAGKSTYLRQVALLVLMAQIGSFVPAQEAKIGITDRIFCRVGASDNIARGESTFLVEMNETAYILRSASPRSLIILDEVGRGTGTRDGLAIAWAVTEYIINALNARTLFATHYHELTSIEHPSLVNLCMDVVDNNSEIIFLKKVKPGSSDSSYGIHVARLAGLPDTVTENARQILERINGMADRKAALPADKPQGEEEGEDDAGVSLFPKPNAQLTLFSPAELMRSEIRNLDLDKLTPLEALNLLFRWKKELGEGPDPNP